MSKGGIAFRKMVCIQEDILLFSNVSVPISFVLYDSETRPGVEKYYNIIQACEEK